MTPIEIEVALRFYWDPNAFAHCSKSHSLEVAMHRLEQEGLLSRTVTGKLKGTDEALMLYAETLRQVPLPIRGWRMP